MQSPKIVMKQREVNAIKVCWKIKDSEHVVWLEAFGCHKMNPAFSSCLWSAWPLKLNKTFGLPPPRPSISSFRWTAIHVSCTHPPRKDIRLGMTWPLWLSLVPSPVFAWCKRICRQLANARNIAQLWNSQLDGERVCLFLHFGNRNLPDWNRFDILSSESFFPRQIRFNSATASSNPFIKYPEVWQNKRSFFCCHTYDNVSQMLDNLKWLYLLCKDQFVCSSKKTLKRQFSSLHVSSSNFEPFFLCQWFTWQK